jgi:hypothetical protein
VKPQATSTPLLGPFEADGQKDGVQEQRRQVNVVDVAALELLKALPELGADPLSDRLRQLPQAGLLAPRLDITRTNAPITIARSGSVRKSLVPRGNNLETNGSAASRTCGISTESSPSAVCTRRGAKPVAQAPLVIGPALIPSAPQPGVELVLDRALDDQPGAEFRQLRQRLPRVLPDSHAKQPIDLLLDLRRRRYGTSHGVGLLHRLAGLEGTYAVALTALGYLQRLWDATAALHALLLCAVRNCIVPGAPRVLRGGLPGDSIGARPRLARAVREPGRGRSGQTLTVTRPPVRSRMRSARDGVCL